MPPDNVSGVSINTQDTTSAQGLIDREGVAKFLSVSVETVKRMEKAKKLQRVQLGERMVRYRRSDLETLIGARTGKEGKRK